MTASSSAALSALVERRMRNWEIAKSQHVNAPLPQAYNTHDFVTISRLAGSGGDEIASRLGERLGWPVFDRNILQVMADDDVVRKRLYESMDERDISWIDEFAQSMQVHESAASEYFQKLSSAMLAIVRQSPAIILGRAGSLILPRQNGLRVQITAPLEFRIKRYMSAHDLSEKQARTAIREIDERRTKFIKTHFAATFNDLDRYDLIINTQCYALDAAVETLASAIKAKKQCSLEPGHH